MRPSRPLNVRVCMSMLPLLTLAALSLAAAPTGPGDDRHADVRLVADADAFTPGEPLWVGVQFELDPHWHVYWQNPGDAGMPPSVTWDLPEGFTASELQYPVPQRFEYSGLVGYGYEGEVTYLVQITPPDELPDGPVTLAAKIDYLICDPSRCVPESAEAAVELTGDASVTHRLSAALAALPAGESPAVREAGPVPDGGFTVLWSGEVPEQVEFFPTPESRLVVESVQVRRTADQHWIDVLARPLGEPEEEQLSGVLAWTNTAGERRGMRIEIPYNLILRQDRR